MPFEPKTGEFQRITGPPARKLVKLCVGAIIVYQAVVLWVWYSFPQWDWTMLRVSLSFADIGTALALSLGLYAYSLQEKSFMSDDLAYFQAIVASMRRAGVDAKQVERLFRHIMNFSDASDTRDSWLEEIEDALAKPSADERAAAFKALVTRVRVINDMDRRRPLKERADT